MTRQEIETSVRRAMATHGLAPDEPIFKAQPDPYRGWNIAVISAQFSKLAAADRRAMVAPALEDVKLAWLDLLAPDEVEWAGPLPGDSEPSELPLWPEALSRASLDVATTVTMASDLDDDLVPPIVATFYSLRGGVGRSTALAHTARILASRRKKVVCVDMDLEAPALPVLLGCEHLVQEDRGVVELLMALDQGITPDYATHLLPAVDAENLFVVPAGRVNADYARKLTQIDPRAWYREDRNPLRAMMEGLKSSLPFQPDVILLDARTGITDLSGPLLFDLSDLAIVAFFPHPQARHGTELLARSIVRRTTGRTMADGTRVVPDLRFVVSPIPASSAPEVRRRYERRPLEWIEGWLAQFNEDRAGAGLQPIEARDVTHIVSYREDVATSDAATGLQAATPAYEPIADWIHRFLRTATEASAVVTSSTGKAQVLSELNFTAGSAEDQVRLLDDYVQTRRVDDALSPDVPLVLGRKGTGKTAAFRFLSERQGARGIVVHAPSALRGNRGWQVSPDGLAAVDDLLSKSALGWRHFWMLYIGVALNAVDGANIQPPPHLSAADLRTEAGLIDALGRSAALTQGPLELRGWLLAYDGVAQLGDMLLFDGLDTGFGSTQTERDRRRHSIEGLFDAWMDIGQSLANLRFKVLLREDIWRQLNFANKSHLYGRSVTLKWEDQSSFLKVVVKQAMRSASFKAMPLVRPSAHLAVDAWPEEAVQQAWIQLVGERMKGGQTAYTRNWVWNRLADANADHSPRHLLQLFREATEWERTEEQKSPYDKAIIRPRALTAQLVTISEQSVGALREEFSELEPMLELLRQIGRTPIDADSLSQHRDLISLAREVGLLGVYEESGDEVSRYRVPDLYRQGLGMTRKGQA